MNIILELFGSGKDLTILQMCCRGFVIFWLSLLLLRISGRRSYGLKSPLDLIISILLGSVLSRAVVGASPFLPVVCCTLLIVILHRLFSWINIHNKTFRHLTEGQKILLFENGNFLEKNMDRALVDREDVIQKVRKQTFQNDLEGIDKIYMERNGEVSVVKLKKEEK
jgi:uncharacterized membrane protein YcaP (DUF421 family)